MGTSKAKKITVVNFFNIFPFNHGGKLAVIGLYKSLSAWFDINIINFDYYDIYYDVISINKHLKVFSLAKPKEFITLENDFYKETGVINDDSIPAYRYYSSMDDVINTVREISKDSEIVITDHPYTYKLIKKACCGKILWYRELNVEYDYRNAIYNGFKNQNELAEEVFQIEKECCEGVSAVFTISQSDADRIQTLYNIPKSKIINISVGYDYKNVEFILPSEKINTDDEYKLSVLFLSSAAPMAIKAVEEIIKIAEDLPFVKFNILGSVGNGFINLTLPKNVLVTGMIDDERKVEYLKTSDAALNLIEGGSGVNIKVLEYFAYGLPVISTEFGVRGLNINNGGEFLLTSSQSVISDIISFNEKNLNYRDKLALNAYSYLKREYDWKNAAEKIVKYIRDGNLFEFNENPDIQLDEINMIKCKSLNTSIECGKNVYIWGTGAHGIMCLDALIKIGANVIGFVDNNKSKWGKNIKGYDIFSTDYFFENGIDAIIVVAVVFFEDILKQIAGKGISANDVFICHNGDLTPYYYDDRKIREIIDEVVGI